MSLDTHFDKVASDRIEATIAMRVMKLEAGAGDCGGGDAECLQAPIGPVASGRCGGVGGLGSGSANSHTTTYDVERPYPVKVPGSANTIPLSGVFWRQELHDEAEFLE
jgi:hypothetical protein